MFRSKWFAIGVFGIGLAVVLGGWLLWQPKPAAARTAQKPSEDSLGYSAFFKGELQKIGQISPQEFARRYPAPSNYLGKITWDPTTAKFWDEFNRAPQQPSSKRGGDFDFRLNDQELAKFKQNGFVVSERLGGQSFAEIFYRIYSRDLPVFITSDARTDSGKWDAIVADVHTDPPSLDDPGCILHQGVGNVDLLLIAIDNGKDRLVYAGPVFSHYEFETPCPVRKSDSEWRQDIRAGRLPPRPAWTGGYLVPGVNPSAKNYAKDD